MPRYFDVCVSLERGLFETNNESLNSLLCAFVVLAMHCNAHRFVSSLPSPLCQLHSVRLPLERNIASFTWEALDINDETVLSIADDGGFLLKLIGEKTKNNLYKDSNDKTKGKFAQMKMCSKTLHNNNMNFSLLGVSWGVWGW